MYNQLQNQCYDTLVVGFIHKCIDLKTKLPIDSCVVCFFLFVKLKETQQNVFAAADFFFFLPNKVKTSLKLLMKNNSTQIGNLNHIRHKNVIK